MSDIQQSTPTHRPKAIAIATLIALSAGLFAYLLALSSHVVVGNSDGATIVLEGQAMAHGNVLLHGWALSLDSFWTIDGIFYMFAVLIAGLHLQLLHIIPALIATLVVAVGALCARDSNNGLAGIFAAATVVIILGLPSPALAIFFLAGPYHVGTALWCLIAFYALRHGRFGWGWTVAVVFLTAGLLGDLQTMTLGVLPLAIAGLIAMLRCWNPRAGIAPLSAAALSVGFALLVREIANAIGTFGLVQANPAAGWSELFSNVPVALHYGYNLLGLGADPFGPSVVPTVLSFIHIIGLVAIIVAVVYFLWSMLRGALLGQPGLDADDRWRLEDIVVLAFFADLITFAYLATAGSNEQARYLTAGTIYGAILAGRLVLRLAAHQPSRAKWSLLAVASVITAAYASASALTLSAAAPVQPASQLGEFLVAHHLNNGIGGYWNASITTLSTDGRVTVRPVIDGPSATIVRYQRQSSSDWYSGQKFSFLSYNTALPIDGINRLSARTTFGRGFTVYAVGTYRVFVWKHPITVGIHGASD